MLLCCFYFRFDIDRLCLAADSLHLQHMVYLSCFYIYEFPDRELELELEEINYEIRQTFDIMIQFDNFFKSIVQKSNKNPLTKVISYK